MPSRRITGRPNITSARSRALQLFQDASVVSIPVPLSKIIQHLEAKHGLAVLPYKFSERISGLLVVIEGMPTIGFNATDPQVRQRFTVAHEIGHFLLGHGSCDPITNQHEEREANRFAADLLMPPELLRADFGLISDMKDLAKKYLVSVEALSYQLRDCGVLQ